MGTRVASGMRITRSKTMIDLRQIDLNLLLAFDAIYAQRSITRAAEVMCLSQPAMSNALSRLRSLSGDRLFIKSHRGVTPTMVAHRLADHVRNALDSLREGLREIPSAHEHNPVLRISCPDYLQPQLLKALIDEQQNHWHVRYYQTRRRDAFDELASGKLDILVDIDQPLQRHTMLRKLLLPVDHYVFAYGQALDAPPLTLEAYLAIPQIQVSSRRDGLSPVDLKLGVTARRRTIAVSLQSSFAARVIADQHPFGLTLPSRVADALGLQQAPLPFEQPLELQLALYVEAKYRFERSREQALRLLLGLFEGSATCGAIARHA
uniref:Putative LysR-type transcriptional activator n=1 Tax=Pseudomonas sp. HI-70 TaxID=341693 RepID=T2HVW5_9PSED|nr:putative LysR-type transcriptional activator [Pseudomonas sp. HI-70]